MLNYLKSAAKKMLIDFDDSKNIKHSVTKGTTRENIIVTHFLKPYIPKKYSINSGIIVDINNQQSKQQDIVIYAEFYSPVLKDLNSNKLFFPESVFTVIEAKSNLNKIDIKDIIEKSVSVRKLAKSFKDKIVISPELIIRSIITPIQCVGIAFESKKSLESLRNDFREIKNSIKYSESLSFIAVLNCKNDETGILLHCNKHNLNQIELIPSTESKIGLLKFKEPGETLLFVYLMIMEHLHNSGIIYPTPDYHKYAKNYGLSDFQISIANEDQKGATIYSDGKPVKVDMINRMSTLTKKLYSDGLDINEFAEYFTNLVKLPGGEIITKKQSRFYVNYECITYITPRLLYEAAHRLIIKENTEIDRTNLKKIQTLFNEVKPKNLIVEMR